MKTYPIENRILASIIEYCNSLENKEVINGNNLAKNLTSMVSIGLLTTQQKLIYDALSENAKDAKFISRETKVPERQVLTQLKQIYTRTQLISFKKEGKIKTWYKYKTN